MRPSWLGSRRTDPACAGWRIFSPRSAIMASSPLDIIAKSPMRLQQYLVVALCCLINISEGFDLLSLAYAAPVISKEWKTAPAMLGLVFSAASTGLAIGAFLLAPLADKIGRRPM